MFVKKIWIPVVCLLIGVAIGSTFYSKHVASQEPIKVYKAVNTDADVKSQGGHFHDDDTWHADDAHSDGGNPQGIASDLSVDRQALIDAEIEAAHQQGATDAEILSKLQVAGHPVETDAEIQRALRRQRVRQYLKDREVWNKKFHQAHSERMQAGRAIVSFIPNLSPDRSPKEIAAYLDSLNDAERKQLFADFDVRIEKGDAAIKKLEAVKQEVHVFPKE